jgi:hypothetical protein
MLAKTPPIGSCAQDSISSIKLEIEDWLYAEVGGEVQSGPFEGMKLPKEKAWRESYLPPMLLGCYEEELHGVLTQQIERLKNWERLPNVVVVGCAEGYYAVGLARRLPKATIYALDIDAMALEIAAIAAKANGVSLKIGAPLNEVFAAPNLIVMDCEGAEVDYLNLDTFPALAGSYIILEVHNLPNQNTDAIILDRFRGTHRIDMIMEGPRNPTNYTQLCALSSTYRWMAVCEGRPCLMAWYSMTPRGMSVS